MLVYVTLAAIAIMLASLAGVLFTARYLAGWVEPRLRILVAFAIGVFVVVFWHLTEEALHDGFSLEVVVAFLFGVLILEGVTRLLPQTHHHHGPHPEHTHSRIDARRLLIGDSVHNVHDGLILVPAFLVSPVVGFATTAGIFFHELVQEISEYFVYREAGYSAKKALLLNLFTSATILLGVVLALLLVSVEELAHPLIAFSAGSFLYIVLRDLVPSVVRQVKQDGRPTRYAVALLCGIGLMFTVSFLAPHEHEEEELPLPDGFGLA